MLTFKQIFCRHKKIDILHIGNWLMDVKCCRCGKEFQIEPGSR